ncbi:DUF6197 family protein [Streptomyces olivaceiscleroticus]|uniref:Uncharacterized protein n=1 Tax=Streptomyces olivaceiscleroticus TaxID=68245 RepID=A0ABP3LJI1_9ACTN
MTTTTSTPQRPRTAPQPAVPAPAILPTRQLVAEALRGVQATPAVPSWGQRLLPATVRGVMADLGLYTNPTPQPPSGHLAQTLAVLRRYGWCKSQDVTLTGKVCIRGAQTLLEKAGHVTPAARERAVAYLQQSLTEINVHMAFFAWNDIPDTPWSQVENRLVRAHHLARKNGE